MRKAFSLTAVLILITALIGSMVSSCSLIENKTVEDLYGWWESKHKQFHYTLYIHDNNIELFYFEDEAEETALFTSRNKWRSLTFEIPQGKFSTYSWETKGDYDRTEIGSDWSYVYADPYFGYGKFEYKNDRIYWEVIGGEIEFRKSTREHPLCEEHLELLQKGYENSLIAEPLKLGDIHYFEETNIPSDKVENSLFCIEITNPNPFRVYFPELVYYKPDGTKGVRIILQYIEAESTIVYVGLDSDRVYDFSDDCCEIHYNPYNTRYKGQEATVVVTDRSKVVTDNNGLVTGVTVETRGEAGSEQINGDQIRDSYFLNVVFYKDNEIVGCGYDVFSQLDMGKTNTIKYFSPVTDYDYYEIYAT